jgi:hypothetical protein
MVVPFVYHNAQLRQTATMGDKHDSESAIVGE